MFVIIQQAKSETRSVTQFLFLKHYHSLNQSNKDLWFKLQYPMSSAIFHGSIKIFVIFWSMVQIGIPLFCLYIGVCKVKYPLMDIACSKTVTWGSFSFVVAPFDIWGNMRLNFHREQRLIHCVAIWYINNVLLHGIVFYLWWCYLILSLPFWDM